MRCHSPQDGSHESEPRREVQLPVDDAFSVYLSQQSRVTFHVLLKTTFHSSVAGTSLVRIPLPVRCVQVRLHFLCPEAHLHKWRRQHMPSGKTKKMSCYYYFWCERLSLFVMFSHQEAETYRAVTFLSWVAAHSAGCKSCTKHQDTAPSGRLCPPVRFHSSHEYLERCFFCVIT